MNEKFNLNNIENEDFTINTKESDYKNLIIKLEEIKATITLLRNKYQDKF